MKAHWPAVAQRLVTLLPTLPGYTNVAVYDGPPVTEDAPLQYVTVGWVDGEVAGTYSQDRSGDGVLVEESGQVHSTFVAQSGDTDLPSVRSSAFALVDALADSIAADQTLGVLPYGSTSSVTASVVPVQNSAGAAVSLIVTLTYFAARSR